jgi:hypothetical protein
MQANVAADLGDAGGDIWSADELARAIRRALRDYSAACPRRQETTLTLQAAGREVDLSGVAGLAGVERVWYPYDDAAPDWPARWPRFEVWPGPTLRLLVDEEPAAGAKLRLFYWTLHALDGLDGATVTSLPAADEDVVALGAAAYAALEKARAAVGAVNVAGRTPEQWASWGEGRLVEFEDRLVEIACRRSLDESAAVPMDSPED